MLRRLLPQPGRADVGEEAYVLNVYTELAHRRRGIARQLTEHIVGWCRERGVARVALHASVDGRPLYEQLGFVATNEMRLQLHWTLTGVIRTSLCKLREKRRRE